MQLGTHTPHPAPPLEQPGAVRLWDEGGVLIPHDPAQVRAQIGALEAALRQHPDAVFGDNSLCPLTHTFAEGFYLRQIFIPKGTVLTGRIHKHSHPNFLMSGEVIVVTEHGGREHLKAPMAMISKAGTKRAVYAVEDTVWCTVHQTTETDPACMVELLTVPDYAALEPAQAPLTPGTEEAL